MYIVKYYINGVHQPPDIETNEFSHAEKMKNQWEEEIDKGNGIKEIHTAIIIKKNNESI